MIPKREKQIEAKEQKERKEFIGTVDEILNQLKPLLSGRKANDNLRFINAVFWMLRTRAPWRDLPASHGEWKNTHRRFSQWRDKGIWEKLLTQLLGEHEMEWLIIDASYVKAHMHTSRAKGGNQGIG